VEDPTVTTPGSGNSNSPGWPPPQDWTSSVVCHYPAGTTKWNKVEHQLFSRITHNWRGRPLETYQTVVNLIANTTTTTGLTVQCELNPNLYPPKSSLPVSRRRPYLSRHDFHGDWDYTIMSLCLLNYFIPAPKTSYGLMNCFS
jgi:hypothetical protein